MISSFNSLILKAQTREGDKGCQGTATAERVSNTHQLLGSVLTGIYDPHHYAAHAADEKSSNFSQGHGAKRGRVWLPTQVYPGSKTRLTALCCLRVTSPTAFSPLQSPPWAAFSNGPQNKAGHVYRATDTGFWAGSKEWTCLLGGKTSDQGLKSFTPRRVRIQLRA